MELQNSVYCKCKSHITMHLFFNVCTHKLCVPEDLVIHKPIDICRLEKHAVLLDLH